VLTAIATLSVLLLLARFGMNVWRRRRLVGAIAETHATLGECMYAAGIDDGEHGAKISALDERLRRAEAVGGSTQALKATRHQLILKLAAAALEDGGPLPGADAEYHKAREAQVALDLHVKGVDPITIKENKP
jgi:hypothetical protein